MKIIVIGLGSMGKRRIRLLNEHKKIKLIGVDSQETRRQEVSEKFGIVCYPSIGEVLAKEKVDAAVVSTSPLSHSSIINECLHHGLHVFTEINLVSDGYDENMKLAKEKGLVLFLSSTQLYKAEIKSMVERVHNSNMRLNYIYHVGQYLPDWHPWESYKSYFIGDKRTNGCREIMAIEMPWLVTAFGNITNSYSVKSKNTSLNIDYCDNYLITLEHESGAKGVFAVDVMARKATRHLEVYGEDIHMAWEGTSDSLSYYDINNKKNVQVKPQEKAEHVEGYADFISENPYRYEIDAFLSQIADNTFVPQWDFDRDKPLLDIIDKIENA